MGLNEISEFATKHKDLLTLAAPFVLAALGGIAWLIWVRKPQSPTSIETKKTVDHLRAQNAQFQAQLDQTLELLKHSMQQNAAGADFQDVNRKIDEIRQSMQTITQVASGDGELAQEARSLLASFHQGPEDPAHLERFDLFIQRYEDGPVQDLVQLYLGRGALSFNSDTQGALCAYSRAAALDPHHMDAHNQIGHLQRRLGDLASAQSAYETVLRLADEQNHTQAQAIAYGNLGVVAGIRGDLDKAQEWYHKALTLNTELGHKEGMANQYGNLGIVAKTRGELEKAEEWYHKSLTLNTELGRKEGMASDYGNLGIVAKTRGELEKAEEWYHKSLTLDTELGRKEGMANQYGNLGVVAQTRGDLDKAEEWYHKALTLNTELGRKEGMAIQYGNLGVVAKTRGELDKAEEWYHKALTLDTQLGRKEGMANQYGNLGIVAKTRGDLDKARALWVQARDLFAQIGAVPLERQVQGWIDALDGKSQDPKDRP